MRGPSMYTLRACISAACLAGSAAVPAGQPVTHDAPRQAAPCPNDDAAGSKHPDPRREARVVRLAVGERLEGCVGPGERLTVDVAVPAGQVVDAVFDGQGTALDLQDRQGRHQRRLAPADAGMQGAMWVADGGATRLTVTPVAPAGGRYAVQLLRSLAPATAPAEAPAAVPDSPRLQALLRSLQQGAGTEAFWREREREGTPLVEPLPDHESLVTFLWRGEQASVRLFGSPTGNHDPLARLPGSDVWWASFRMPDTARLSYRLAPDVPRVQGSAMDQRRVILATVQRDPLNPRIYPPPASGSAIDAFEGHSVLELPQAPPQPWVTRRAGVAAGQLEHHRLRSSVLRNERDVWLYRPAGNAPQALLVLFDGHAYLGQVPTPTIVDNLLADRLIPPTAVVLLGNASPQARATELPPNPAFATFLDRELMPWLQAQGLAQPPARTVVAGSSYGGLAAAYAGMVLPQRFGRVLSLSGSFWWSPAGTMPGWLMRQYAASPRQPVQFYLDAGRYEGARGGQDGILETSRHLGDVLRAKGYAVTQVEHDTGHDYLHWQGSLGCGLVALLNPDALPRLDAPCGDHSPPRERKD